MRVLLLPTLIWKLYWEVLWNIRIVLTIQDRPKANNLISFLKDLDYVEIIEVTDVRKPIEISEKLAAFKQLTNDIRELNKTDPLPPAFDEAMSRSHNDSRRLRGMLKDSGYTTEHYFEQKRIDKELEG